MVEGALDSIERPFHSASLFRCFAYKRQPPQTSPFGSAQGQVDNAKYVPNSEASTEIARSSSERRASSAPRAAEFGVLLTGLQSPRDRCSLPSPCPERSLGHQTLP